MTSESPVANAKTYKWLVDLLTATDKIILANSHENIFIIAVIIAVKCLRYSALVPCQQQPPTPVVTAPSQRDEAGGPPQRRRRRRWSCLHRPGPDRGQSQLQLPGQPSVSSQQQQQQGGGRRQVELRVSHIVESGVVLASTEETAATEENWQAGTLQRGNSGRNRRTRSRAPPA